MCVPPICYTCVHMMVGRKGQSKIVSTLAELFYLRELYAFIKCVSNSNYSSLYDSASIFPWNYGYHCLLERVYLYYLLISLYSCMCQEL